MSLIYICNNPDHPVQKHSKEYSAITQDGFCPDCPFGEGILIEVEANENAPGDVTPLLVVDNIGLCILVCDASGSMTEPAFPNSKPRKIDMVVRSAANGIVDNYIMNSPGKAYIALIGFGGKASLMRDSRGQPFIKPIDQIQKEFPTAETLAEFIRAQLAPDNGDPLTETIDRNYTDISGALAIAHTMYQHALQGDLSEFGLEKRFTLMEHNPVRQRDSHQYTIPNVRILIYSDGAHNHPQGAALETPFTNNLEANEVSVLMTVFFGDGADQGADQMRLLACTCPIHEQKGYFLINSAERYQTLRKLFRMASGTSGFCPVCLAEASKEWSNR